MNRREFLKLMGAAAVVSQVPLLPAGPEGQNSIITDDDSLTIGAILDAKARMKKETGRTPTSVYMNQKSFDELTAIAELGGHSKVDRTNLFGMNVYITN
jgi:hypothetical protein